MLVLHKNEEKPFRDFIMKRYELDRVYNFLTLVNLLVSKNNKITEIHLSEDCDIGCNMNLGSYTPDEFLQVYDYISEDFIMSYSIFLDDPDLYSLHMAPNSATITAFFKTPDKELSDYFN